MRLLTGSMRNPRLKFGELRGTAERALIVATGPSARDAPLGRIAELADAGVCVIAVNRAITMLDRANIFFTLDPDEHVRPLLLDQKPGTDYYAAVPIDYGLPFACKTEHRHGIPANVTYLKRVIGPPPNFWMGGMPRARGRGGIHTGNSAWGALQIAYLLGAKRVGLIGVDATPEGYAFDEGSPRNLNLLPWVMRTGLADLHEAGMRVVNGSPDSRVACFSKATPAECVEWVAR